jgi:hypothetical protein
MIDDRLMALPRAQRYSPDVFEADMAIVRGWLACGGCRKDELGRWVEDPSTTTWTRMVDRARQCFPEPDRQRTLMVVAAESPFYLERLTADDRDLYYALARLSAEKLEGAGFAAMEMGKGYAPDDYTDRCHLSESGGALLAAQVADRVQRMALELGYKTDGKEQSP